ncbi:MAG: asparagine synthase-related protein [Desulfobacteraceae bacterium]
MIQILVSGFFLDNSTLVEDIKRFPAATVFRRSTTDHFPIEMKSYWSMPKQEGEQAILDQDTINVFNEKMQRAIDELHALESHSVIPLSGGLDSRAIACFIARKQKIKTITYDFGDETTIAAKVCNILKGEPAFFSKKIIQSPSFREGLTQMIRQQQNHSVVNQYFYAPLFSRFFKENPQYNAIYDGVYMDILFNYAYIYIDFDFKRFLKTYGGAVQFVESFSHSMDRQSLDLLMRSFYSGVLAGYETCDGVAKSQQCYASGRLRRYVSESYLSRENYCYVFKPGFNYDLMDFGFGLDLKLRKGLIYTTLLNKEFPDVMKVRYKDSYNNREKTALEKMDQKYGRFRSRLSSASQGLIKYYPFQADYYFLHEKGLDAFKDLFAGKNYIPEVFDNETISSIFNKVKRKQYLVNYLHRILFLQQFYQRNNF